MWLLEHAAQILTVRAVGTDGRTAWKRIRGRDFGIRVVGFGEQVMYKLPMKGSEKIKRGHAAGNFEKATYIGFNKVNCEHRFVDGHSSIVTSRHVVRLPEEQRWNLEALQAIKVTPWQTKLDANIEATTGRAV